MYTVTWTIHYLSDAQKDSVLDAIEGFENALAESGLITLDQSDIGMVSVP